jgi:hypothetical protein
MPDEGRRSKIDFAFACLAVLVGGTILALAVPRLGAAFWLGLRNYEAELINAGLPVSESELHGLIASRELALAWIEAREAHDDLAAALALLASMREPESAAERELLERAVQETRTGLALAPADPRGWLQLAYLTTMLDRRSQQAVEALQFSILIGPYDSPEFLALRLDLALSHWALFDEAARRQLEEQVRLLWQEAPGEIALLALDEPDYFGPIASVLEGLAGAQQRLAGIVREMVQEVRPAPNG